jgi:hypothetical protein
MLTSFLANLYACSGTMLHCALAELRRTPASVGYRSNDIHRQLNIDQNNTLARWRDTRNFQYPVLFGTTPFATSREIQNRPHATCSNIMDFWNKKSTPPRTQNVQPPIQPDSPRLRRGLVHHQPLHEHRPQLPQDRPTQDRRGPPRQA